MARSRYRGMFCGRSESKRNCGGNGSCCGNPYRFLVLPRPSEISPILRREKMISDLIPDELLFLIMNCDQVLYNIMGTMVCKGLNIRRAVPGEPGTMSFESTTYFHPKFKRNELSFHPPAITRNRRHFLAPRPDIDTSVHTYCGLTWVQGHDYTTLTLRINYECNGFRMDFALVFWPGFARVGSEFSLKICVSEEVREQFVWSEDDDDDYGELCIISRNVISTIWTDPDDPSATVFRSRERVYEALAKASAPLYKAVRLLFPVKTSPETR